MRTHRRLIAVSDGTAERLHAMNHRTHIDVIGNGVDVALFQQQLQLGRDVLFVGRLEIRALANRLGVSDHVRFVGWVRGPEKHQLLSGSRLVVVPSRHETVSIVAVEALAAATPVLAFDIPCLREVVPPGCGWRVHASTSPRSPPNSSLSIPIVIVCSPPDVTLDRDVQPCQKDQVHDQ